MSTIITRAVKGTPLTHVEVDANFTNLNTDKLDTAGIALGSAASPTLKFTGDTNTGIYSPGADQVAISTNGTGRLFVESDGRVGIGAANTTGGINLQVIGSTPILRVTGTSATNPKLELVSVGATLWSQIVSGSDGSLSFNRDGTERMRLDSSGRLGLGTSSPVTALQVIGISTFGDGVGGRLQVTTGSNLGYIDSLNNTSTQWQPLIERGTEIQFHTNTAGVTPVEKMRVDSNGFANHTGAIGRGAPVTKTGNFTVGIAENWLICNGTASITTTLPTASAWIGREIMLKTSAAFTVISASSNVVPLAGGAAGTAILAATAGRYATLVSDGTNWVIMQAN